MATKIEDCFTSEGKIKFDPYRCDKDYHLYQILFTEDGFLQNSYDLEKLIIRKNWTWDSVAVGLFHANILANATKGSYPTIDYFR